MDVFLYFSKLYYFKTLSLELELDDFLNVQGSTPGIYLSILSPVAPRFHVGSTVLNSNSQEQ